MRQPARAAARVAVARQEALGQWIEFVIGGRPERPQGAVDVRHAGLDFARPGRGADSPGACARTARSRSRPGDGHRRRRTTSQLSATFCGSSRSTRSVLPRTCWTRDACRCATEVDEDVRAWCVPQSSPRRACVPIRQRDRPASRKSVTSGTHVRGVQPTWPGATSTTSSQPGPGPSGRADHAIGSNCSKAAVRWACCRAKVD